MKPVLYRYKDTESVVRAMDGYTPGPGWVPLFDEAAMKAATAAALERAAKACQNVARKQGTIARQLAAMECSEVVRALKDES